MRLFKINNKIKTIVKNSNARTVFSNFIALSLLQIANYVFPLITLPYLATVLGAENFGKIAFSQAVIVWFQTLVDYGFLYSGVRDVARVRANIDEVSNIFSNIMWARFMLLALSFVLLVLLVIFVPVFRSDWLLLLLSFGIVFGHTLFPEWLFQGLEKMKYITILNVVTKLFFTVCVFIVIKRKEDYYLHPILMAFGYIISGAISLYIINKMGILLRRPRFGVMCRTIIENTDLFINQIVPNLYSNFSVILLGAFHGQAANGILDIGRKFSNIAVSILSVISRVFFPFLSRDIKKHSTFAIFQIGIATLFAGILFLFSSIIIECFFTSEYLKAIKIIRILSVSVVAQSLINVYGTNYLIVQGHERTVRNATLYASLIGFLCAFPLVYYYSYIGVAVVISLSTSLMAIFIIMSYLKVVNNERNEVA